MPLLKQNNAVLDSPEALLRPIFKGSGFWQPFYTDKGQELRCVFERVSPLVTPFDESLGALGRTHIAFNEKRVRSMLRNKAYAVSDRVHISNSFRSYPLRKVA